MGCIGLLAVVLMLCVDGVGASEFWSGVTPSEAIIGRNTTFTLDVTGLLTGEEVGLYTCQFRTSLVDPLRGEHLDLSSPVRVLSPTSAECDAPEWDLPGVDAVLDLYKGDWSLSKKGWPAVVAFRPVALSIAPQVGIAAGGYNLTVAGLGFYEDADEPYRIVLTGRNRTVEGGTTESVVSEPCVVTEKSTIELICVAPPWPSAAEATQVALRLGDVEVLLDGPMGSMLFNYTPSCSGFSTRVADAVRRINVSIAGHGFGLDEPASCRFLPVNGGGGAVTSAVVHGPGAISCPTPVWSEPGCVSPAGCGQNATLELLLGESLTCADESGSFAFTSVWAGATPTRGLASGGYLLTVTGGGFDLDSDQIACQFTCGGATFLSQRTRPRDPATVVCNVPQAPRLPCVANLVLVQGGSLIASNGSAVAFTFQHVWNSASRTAAPAVGGAFISLRGVFDPAATYVCVFASESLRKQRAASLLSATELQCTVPPWPESETVALTVEAGGTLLARDPPDVFYLRFTADYWFTAEPLSVSVLDSTELRFAGKFRPGAAGYSCVVYAGTDQRIGTVAASSVTEGELRCTLPAWAPLKEASGTVALLFEGEEISLAGGEVTMVFRPAWRSVSVSTGPASGGTKIVVSGEGFTNIKGLYSCRFCQPAGDYCSDSVEPAEFVDARTLECASPPLLAAAESMQFSLVTGIGPIDQRCDASPCEPASSLFKFTPVWHAYAPGILPVSGSAITVEGFGFDAALHCECVFVAADGNITDDPSRSVANVTVVNSTVLVCEPFVWEHPVALARPAVWCNGTMIPLSSLEPGAEAPTAPKVVFLFSSVASVAPSAGPASGGTLLRIRGTNFCYSEPACATLFAYSCELRAPGNDTAFLTMPTTDVTSDYVECLAPRWDYAAPALLDVALVNNLLSRTVVTSGAANATRFLFTPVVEAASVPPCAACACPSGAPCLAAGEPQEVTLSGAGFNASLSGYVCSVQLAAFGGAVSTVESAPARPASAGTLRCTIPALPDDVPAQQANLSLVAPDAALIPARQAVEYFPQWSALAPMAVYANGCAARRAPCPSNLATLILTVFGLDPMAMYRCDFQAADGRRRRGLLAQPLAPSRLECWLPSWNDTSVPLSVTLLDGSDTVVELTADAPAQAVALIPIVTAFSVDSLPSSGGTAVTLSGAGLNRTSAYRCVFSDPHGIVLFTVDANVTSSDAAHCKVPDLIMTARRALLSLEKLPEEEPVALAEELDGGAISFVQFWSTGNASEGFARGGEPLKIVGSGFQKGSSGLACRFVDGARAVTAAAEALSTTELACTTPAWPYEATEVELQILDGNARIPHSSGGAVPFTFRASWRFPSIQGSSIDGGAVVSVVGFGFDPQSEYTLLFALSTNGTNGTNGTDDDAYGMLDGDNETTAALFATAFPSSYSAIEFTAPEGPPVEQVTVCSLETQGGESVLLDAAAESVAFEFVADWYGAESVWEGLRFGGANETLRLASPATGGVSITIFGHGFSMGIAYGCVFTSSKGNTAYSADAINITDSQLLCTAPRWAFSQGSTRIDIERRGEDAEWVTAVDKRSDVRFRFHAAVEGVDSQVPSTQNVIAIAGAGFDRFVSYQCIFTRGNLSGAELPDERLLTLTWFSTPSLLHCRNSDWGLLYLAEGGNVSFALAEEVSNGREPDVTVEGTPLIVSDSALPLPLELEMLPAWYRLNVSRVSVQGGARVLVSVAGLVGHTAPERFSGAGGRSYTCNFTDPGTGFFVEAQSVIPTATVYAPLVATELVCTAPHWPYGEAETVLSITDSLGTTVIFSGDSPTFTMASSWRSITPREAFARGVESLTVTGVGFDNETRSEYRLLLESPNASAWTSRSEPCVVVAWDTLRCTAPVWPFPAHKVHLNVTRNGVPIDFDPAYTREDFVVLNGWELVEPSSGAAKGGTLVSLVAFGLDESLPLGTYQCVFSTSAEETVAAMTETLALRVDATVLAHNALECTTPVWGDYFAAGAVFLHVIHSQALVRPLGGAPVSFEFNTTATRLSTQSLYAQGGQTLGIDGFGFKDGAYRLVWVTASTDDGGANESSPATCTPTASTTRLKCVTSEWEYPAAPVVLLLDHDDEAEPVAFEQPDAALARFWSSWQAMQVQATEAGGGATLTVFGAGFDPAVALSCVFSSANSSYEAHACAEYSGVNELTCVAPAFLAPEEAAVSSLIFRESKFEAPFTGSDRTMKFTAGVVKVEPPEGLATGGLTVAVTGFGFDAAAPLGVFQCLWTTLEGTEFRVTTDTDGAVFVSTGDSTATAADDVAVLADVSLASSTELSCVTPYWGESRPAGNVSFHVLRDGVPLPTNGTRPPLNFLFIPSWASLAPAFGPAGGDATITVSGAGFDLQAGDKYLCVFSNEHRVPGQRAVSTALTVVGLPKITCVTPRWPYPAARVRFDLTLHGESVPFSGPVPTYDIRSSWQNASAYQGPAEGGQPLGVTGDGFDAAMAYRCVFVSERGANFSSPAQVHSLNNVTCDTPFWDAGEETALFTIVSPNHTSLFLPGRVDGAVEYFLFYARLTRVSVPLRPDARFARGGVTISLGGFGYDTLAQPGTYTCVWSLMADVGQANASNVDWDLSLSVDARVLSSVLVSCVTPKWGASFAAENATLFLFVGDALIPDPVPFRFHTVADSIRPSFSGALGGGKLNISGFGFNGDTPLATSSHVYTIRLVNALNDSSTVLDCESVQDPTLLVCPAPRWRYESAALAVELSWRGELVRFASPGAGTYTVRTAWTNKSIAAGHSSGGDRLAVSGAGFDQRSNYSCVFSVAGYSAFACAEVQTDERIECKTPLWDWTAGEAAVYVVQRSAAGFQEALFLSDDPQERHFQFLESLIAVAPSAGFASGGRTITVVGSGFDTDALPGAYQCAWSELVKPFDVLLNSEGNLERLVPPGGDANSTEFTNATAVSHGALMCETPAWGEAHAAQAVNVTVFKDGEAISHEAALNFDFSESWDELHPTAGPAEGGILVTFSGYGFVAEAPYVCVFSTENGTRSANSTATTVLSTTSLACELPRWEYVQADTSAAIMLGSDTVALLPGASAAFRYLHSWSVVAPSQAPGQGGALLTVHGAGFNASLAYSCRWSAEDGFAVAVNASVASAAEIVCKAPYWDAPAQVVALTLQSLADEASVFPTDVVLLGTATGEFKWDAGFISADPTIGSASGGDRVTVSGFSFNDSAVPGQFRCMWSLFDAADVPTVPTQWPDTVLFTDAEILSVTTLECDSAAFGDTFPAGIALLNVTEGSTFLAASTMGGISFTFLREVTAVQPTEGSSGGGESVTLSGAGFYTDHDALLCVFISDDPAHAETADATIVDTTTATCTTPAWGNGRTTAQVYIHMNGEPTNTTALSTSTFTFRGALTDITAEEDTGPFSSVTAGGGAKITVSGFGFHPVSQYSCRFTDTSNDARYVVSTAVSPTDDTELVCELPQWPFPAAETQVEVYEDGVNRFPLSEVAEEPLLLNIWEEVVSVEPSSGDYRGGTTITVHGHGFRDEPGDHPITFNNYLIWLWYDSLDDWILVGGDWANYNTLPHVTVESSNVIIFDLHDWSLTVDEGYNDYDEDDLTSITGEEAIFEVWYDDDTTVVYPWGKENTIREPKFSLEVVNRAPTLEVVNIVWEENGGAYSAAWGNFTRGKWDPDTPSTDDYGQQVTFILSAHPPSLFKTQPAVQPCSDADDCVTTTLTFEPALGIFGVALIDVVLQDDGGTNAAGVDTSHFRFSIHLGRSLFAPSFDAPDLPVDEDAGRYSVPNFFQHISPGSSEELLQTFSFQIEALEPDYFIEQPAATAFGELSFRTALNVNGNTTVRARLVDSGADQSEWQNFTLAIRPVNDAPLYRIDAKNVRRMGGVTLTEELGPCFSENAHAILISPGPSTDAFGEDCLEIDDDSGGFVYALGRLGCNELHQTYTFVVEQVSGPVLTVGPPNITAEGALEFCLAPNSCNNSLIECVGSYVAFLVDDGGAERGGVNKSVAAQTFSIIVQHVNHAPSFVTARVTLDMLLEQGPVVRNDAISALSRGASDEEFQEVTFFVSVVNETYDLFRVPPRILANGTLMFQPYANTYGTAAVSVYVRDNGGTLFDGDDRSPVQVFYIDVLAVNRAPVFTLQRRNVVVWEGNGSYAEVGFAHNIHVGPRQEVDGGQALSFVVRKIAGRAELFASPPRISADGTLQFELRDYEHGNASFTVVAVDDGGHDNDGVNSSLVAEFAVLVLSVNQRPTFNLSAPETLASGVLVGALNRSAVVLPAGDWRDTLISVQHDADEPAVVETRRVIASAGGNATLHEPFASFRLEGSATHPDAMGLYYPTATLPGGALAYAQTGGGFFAYHHAGYMARAGCSAFWVVDSAPHFRRPLGFVRSLDLRAEAMHREADLG